jgi:hypothetical protein
MQGTRPGRRPRPSKTTPTGRVCDQPGCTTGLSIYNPKSRCWQHTEIAFPNFRGKRLANGKA